jgi:hypothetical protein
LPVFPGRATASDNDSWRWVSSVWVAFQERGVYSSYTRNDIDMRGNIRTGSILIERMTVAGS